MEQSIINILLNQGVAIAMLAIIVAFVWLLAWPWFVRHQQMIDERHREYYRLLEEKDNRTMQAYRHCQEHMQVVVERNNAALEKNAQCFAELQQAVLRLLEQMQSGGTND